MTIFTQKNIEALNKLETINRLSYILNDQIKLTATKDGNVSIARLNNNDQFTFKYTEKGFVFDAMNVDQLTRVDLDVILKLIITLTSVISYSGSTLLD